MLGWQNENKPKTSQESEWKELFAFLCNEIFFFYIYLNEGLMIIDNVCGCPLEFLSPEIYVHARAFGFTARLPTDP